MAKTPEFDPTSVAINIAKLEGQREGLSHMLTWLEERYMAPGASRPDRGTPKAEAILAIAGDAAKEMRRKLAALDG